MSSSFPLKACVSFGPPPPWGGHHPLLPRASPAAREAGHTHLEVTEGERGEWQQSGGGADCPLLFCFMPACVGTVRLPSAATALAYILALPRDMQTRHSQATRRTLAACSPNNSLSPGCPGGLSARGTSGFLCCPSPDQGFSACPRAGWQSPSPADFHSPAHRETSQSCGASCPADPWGHGHFLRRSLLSVKLPHFPLGRLGWPNPVSCSTRG